jgi:hypothetical protein
MQLPSNVLAVVKLFEPQLPQGDDWTDENRRAWNIKVAQQVRWLFGPKWGTKRADATRPISKDALAYMDVDNLWAFDTVNGMTRKVNDSVEGIDISNQIFVVVSPIDHLGLGSAPVEPPEQPAEPPAAPACSCNCTQEWVKVEAAHLVDSLRAEYLETLKELRLRLEALEGAKYRVETATTRNSWPPHSHSIRADVTRIK